MAGIVYFASYARDFVKYETAAPSDAWRGFTERLTKALGPRETVVGFGFSVPSILCALRRRTPLPFVDSWIMYIGAPQGSTFRREYMERWERAMADRSVRFFIVQPGVAMFPTLRFDPDREERSEAIVAEHFPLQKLEALGFAPSTTFTPETSSGLVVYERAR